MNSPRSKIRRDDGRKIPVQERGRTISRSRSRAPPSPERLLRSSKVDDRDDANSAGAMHQSAMKVRIGQEYSNSPWGSSTSSISKNSDARDHCRTDDRSFSSVSGSARLEFDSLSSVASSNSRAQMTFPASIASASSGALSLLSEKKRTNTYADEYLRAAIRSPGNRSTRKAALDSSVPFPSNSTLSHSSYMSEAGRDYDDPPEITSIPTDEIVDSFTRPTADIAEDDSEKNINETVMRGSRDQYTLGRLQARASKRRELLQQVPEEEDVTNFHQRTRASRIKHIRSLYLPLDTGDMLSATPSKATSRGAEIHDQNPAIGESADGSPNNRSFGESSVDCLNNASSVNRPAVNVSNNRSVMSLKLSSAEASVRSPRRHSGSSISVAGRPSERSLKSSFSKDDLQGSRLSTTGNSSGSRSSHSVNNASDVGSPIVSPTNRSVDRLSTIENSVGTANIESPIYSLGNSLTNGSAAQSFSRKSTLTGSKSGTLSSDEMSEYRVKLFAKMLRLLDDVEHPGVCASSTRGSQNDERSYEYSVAELKLIQKRTEEEMSRILNEFDRSKGNKIEAVQKEKRLNRSSKIGASIKESNGEPECSSRSEDENGPPPDKIMLSQAIASKLSDITSPTACQDGSGVYLDLSSNNYYCVIENNEDELTELTPWNRPPRPSSPRKKKNPSVSTSVGKESLPIVQESPEFATESLSNVESKDCQADTSMDEMHRMQSIKSAESKIIPQCTADSNSTDISLNTPDNCVCEARGSQSASARNGLQCYVGGLGKKQSSSKSFKNQVNESEGVKRTQPRSSCPDRTKLSDVALDSEGFDEISEADEVRESGVVNEMMFHGEEGPLYHVVSKMTTAAQNEARDLLIAASRSAARRTVKKQRKQAEDRFHDGIMKAVSAAEEMQRLNDEVMDEVYQTFDCDELPKINKDYLEGDDLLAVPVVEAKEEELYIDKSIQLEQLNAPSHEQCGCVIQ